MSQTILFFSCCTSFGILMCITKAIWKAEDGRGSSPSMCTWEQPHRSCASGTGTAPGFAGCPPRDRCGGMPAPGPSQAQRTPARGFPARPPPAPLTQHTPPLRAGCLHLLRTGMDTGQSEFYPFLYLQNTSIYLYNLYTIYLGCCLNEELNPDPSQDHCEGHEPGHALAPFWNNSCYRYLKAKEDKHPHTPLDYCRILLTSQYTLYFHPSGNKRHQK